jgi:SAM-dependent methyltransferase
VDVDYGRAATDYGRHRTGFPDAFFERLLAFGIGERSQRILDLGTGTGALARGFASRGCVVTGIDVAEPMLEQARHLDRQAGVSVEYTVARAEATGLPDDSFDVATAGQCWHWFDRPRAAAEARRVLVPGGRLLIAHFDPVSLPGNVVEATMDLIRRHNPESEMNYRESGIYPAWLRDVAIAGFRDMETFSFDASVPHTHERWRGRIRASAWIGASLSIDGVQRFDRELARLLRNRYPEEPIEVLHRVFAIVCSAPRQ